MFDARKQEVYTALYDCRDEPTPLINDCVLPPATFLERLETPAIFVGEGAVRYRHEIEQRLGGRAHFAPPAVNAPRASSGAQLATMAFRRGDIPTLATLAPIYIRPSEAELAKMRHSGL